MTVANDLWPRRTRRPDPALILPALACLLMVGYLSLDLGANDLVGGDEGFYGVMARNVGHGWRFVANPSFLPLGTPGDKPLLFPVLLAAALRLVPAADVSLRLMNLLLAVSTSFFLALIGREVKRVEAGLWASVLYLSAPFLFVAGRVVQAESGVVFFSTAGVWLGLRAWPRRSTPLAVAAGLLFGCAFLCKIWLALPGAAAVLLLGRSRRLAAGLVLGFVLVAPLQFLLCALISPEMVGHWARIYFGFSLAGRVSGQGFASYWKQPWYFYLDLLAHDLALWTPLAVLGAVSLAGRFRIRGEPEERLPLLLLIWLLALLPMSLAPVKSGGYLLPLLPPAYLVGGFGLARLREDLHGRAAWSGRAWALGAGALLLSVLSQIRWTRGPRVDNPAVAGIAGLWLLLLLGSRVRHFPRSWKRPALLVLVALTVAAGLARDRQLARSRPHVTLYRRAAEILRPALAEVDPRQACFFAPEWPSLSFYTFRTGRYWDSPYLPAEPDSVLRALRGTRPFFFVTDTGRNRLYGGLPDSTTAAALQREGHRLPGLPPEAVTVVCNDALWESLKRSGAVRGP